MQHPFDALKQEYADLNARAVIEPSREHELARVAIRLRKDQAVYAQVEAKTGVPVAVLMALSEREMSGNLRCYLGNGQRLSMRTTIVPRGRGPFPDFVAGALDALHLDGLDKIADEPGGWSMERFCYESELWNGFGYRSHGIPSPYVYGATTVQRPGKFPRDHFFDPALMDPQLGTLAIVEELIRQDPSLAFDTVAEKIDDAAPVTIAAAPVGVGGGVDVRTLQSQLGIRVDGIYGRGTKEAVRAFQYHHGLAVDGLAGPKTLHALGLA